jgi:hypothetical protein
VSVDLDDLDQLETLERKREEMLRRLLSNALRDEGHVLVQAIHMGRSDSYVGQASFRWVDKNLRLYTQLPLLKNKVDENGQLIVDEETIEELQQRAPHWDRQYVLTNYLLRQRNRKFPPLLVVVLEDWVNNPEAHEWDKQGRAKRSSIPIRFLDHDGRIGLIDFRQGVTPFAIDGSHRTIAIFGLIEAIHKGVLPLRNAAGKVIGSRSLDELLEDANLTQFDIEGIEDETIGIEFLPAVMKGETREEARIRIRSIFVHVNKTAVPPTLGEQVMLDEDNGFAIVTRRIGLSHQLFRRNRSGDRINWKSTSLPSGGNWITPAIVLSNMAEAYLGVKKPYSLWAAVKKKEIPLRPSDEQLRDGETEFRDFLDRVMQLRPFADIIRAGDIDSWREFPDKGGKGHLLLRPLGQLMLAKAVGYLHNAESGPRQSLDEIFKKLAAFDKAGGFEKVTDASSIWFGITYNPQREVMSMSDQPVAAQMLIYLLGGSEAEEREHLLARFRDLRTIKVSDTETHAYDWNGKDVKDPEKIQLPPLI